MLTQLGYAAGIVLFAPLGNRLDRRHVIVVKLVALAAALTLAGLSSSVGLLAAASLAIGLLATTAQDFVPAAAALAPPAARGKTVGGVMTGLLLGILLSRLSPSQARRQPAALATRPHLGPAPCGLAGPRASGRARAEQRGDQGPAAAARVERGEGASASSVEGRPEGSPAARRRPQRSGLRHAPLRRSRGSSRNRGISGERPPQAAPLVGALSSGGVSGGRLQAGAAFLRLASASRAH